MNHSHAIREVRCPVVTEPARAPASPNEARSESPPHRHQYPVQPVAMQRSPGHMRGAAGSSAGYPAGERRPPIAARQPKLLDRVRDAIRTRHYSYRTEACLPKP